MTSRSTSTRAARRLVLACAVVAICGACSSGSGGDSHAGSSTTKPTIPQSTVTPPTAIPPTVTPPTVTPPTVPAHRVLVPASIDATGRADVTSSLQRFLASVPSGRVIQFRKGGRYRVEGTLFLRNRNRITIDGNGATVFATTRGTRDRAQWWIKGGTRIVFRNLLVRGAHQNAGVSGRAYVRNLESQHGFRLEGVSGAELDHVQVNDVYGDFVDIGRGKDRIPSRNIWIHDSRFSGNGRQGIAVTAASNVVIERNHLDRTARSTFDLEPDTRSAHVSNVFVLNNTVGKGRLLFVASHGGGPVSNVVISGNRLVGHSMTIDSVGPELNPRRSNWVVVDNTSDTPAQGRLMRFFRTDGLVVRGNRQLVTGNEPPVVLTDVCGAHVSDNQFGSTRIREIGARCDAPLVVPTPQALPGRGGSGTVPPVSTPPSTPIPTTPAPSATPAPSTTTLPATAPRSGGGLDLAGWIFIALGACVLAAAVFMIRSRRPR
jgi:hypothetical protein